jgi:hypothetical protein
MTHDELLERVDNYISSECDCASCQFINGPYKALRAVVELHKPYEPTKIGTVCKACGITEDYPCHTIQAIEEQLK